MLLVEEFEQHRVELVFVNAPREDTPEGRMLFGLKGLFSEYERAKILERTRRGKEKRVRDGRGIGSPFIPVGYPYMQGEGRYVVNEEQAEWVRQIYRWLVENHLSMREVARRL